MIVNGKKTNILSDNIADLLRQLKIKNKLIAVEVNRNIIPKSQYTSFKININDKIEIIHAVGGG